MRPDLFEELVMSAKQALVHATCPLLPCGTLVVLKDDAPITKVGSIVLAPHAERSRYRGTVAAVGPEVEDRELSVGSKIIYSRWLSEVEVGDEKWLLVRSDDVLARLEP